MHNIYMCIVCMEYVVMWHNEIYTRTSRALCTSSIVVYYCTYTYMYIHVHYWYIVVYTCVDERHAEDISVAVDTR